jgi:hypothetical protein
VAAVVALVLLGAACGGDDDDAAADDDSTSEETPESEESAGGDTTVFCDARAEIEQQFNAEQPDVEAITGLLDDLESSATPELAANAAGLGEVLAQAAEANADPTMDPAFGENIGAIDEFVLAECGFERVDVSGVEYAFEGLPETVAPGRTAFVLGNDGAERHELVLFKLADGEERPAAELFALPEEEIFASLTPTGGAGAEPGDTGVTIADLEPGRYVASCFVPVGGAEDGPPHFMEGMTAEFEVA